ncbi:MAG: SDR family NAD(P)-dependent oxidoreductase [Leptolyngbya sp. SIOISBB]|nr:SDR family NAD(P)-dependent oxidoreductase [Leptolyngbya sp. SIOISBB]
MTMLAGKVVLLTGASRGIGRVIAQKLAEEQAIVVGVARSQHGLEALCQTIQDAGGKATGIAWDLSDIHLLSDLIAQVEAQVGAVDILINNAGLEIYRAFQDYSAAELQAVLNVNLLAAMELARLVLPGMIQRQSGHLVNIASNAAKKGHPFDSVYSASKAGLLMWGDAVRQELRHTDVAISTLCPGYVEQCGMLVDTGVPAPQLAGTSTPEAVAAAVIHAIQYNQAEIVINKDVVSAHITKLMFALCQFSPRLGDAIYRAIGIPQLNQRRIEHRRQSPRSPQPEFVKD